MQRFGHRVGEAEPPGDERDPAQRRDRAEPALPGKRQLVEAEREEQRTRTNNQPRGDRQARPGPAAHRLRHREQRQRVVHLVTHARLERRQ
jgi:hypothetical protein